MSKECVIRKVVDADVDVDVDNIKKAVYKLIPIIFHEARDKNNNVNLSQLVTVLVNTIFRVLAMYFFGREIEIKDKDREAFARTLEGMGQGLTDISESKADCDILINEMLGVLVSESKNHEA